jgi:uncharacterized protein
VGAFEQVNLDAPVLVEVDELPLPQRPQSADPDFWDVWTLEKDRPINWASVAQSWTGEESTDDG